MTMKTSLILLFLWCALSVYAQNEKTDTLSILSTDSDKKEDAIMEQPTHDIQAIKEAFAQSFIEALSSKSVEACADLVLNEEDNKFLEIDYGLSKKAYRRRLLKQSKNFLKEHRKFIDKQNAHKESAISIENFAEIDTYDFELPEGYSASFINTISIYMKKRLVNGMVYRVRFLIKDALLINGKIKINNLFTVRMYENSWEEINEENTPY